MLLIIGLILLLALFGAGFAAHVLWIVAAVVLVLWLIGLLTNQA
jgi:energy-coupling factor transporter transmembrane protein EcfT